MIVFIYLFLQRAVKAIDGDRGVNNRIRYSLLDDRQQSGDYFEIDADSGSVTVKTELDREGSAGVSNGAYVLTVVATEVDDRAQPSATAEVTVLVLDVNDETPRFRSAQYVAEVDENSPVNMPLTLVGGSVAHVFDHDQGSNGTFQLSVRCRKPAAAGAAGQGPEEQDGDLFDVHPATVVNEAAFTIRVKNQSRLDYERLNATVSCVITARELVTWQPKSSSASLAVRVRDLNDNVPQFERGSYEARLAENASAGTVVARVRATDADSGVFGTAGVRYTSLQGSMADRLHLDPATGVVTVAKAAAAMLDREKLTEFTVIVEAKDFDGRGNANTVQLRVLLDDVNDNAPVFIQSHFDIYINENDRRFPYRFRIEAFDRDLNGQFAFSFVSLHSTRNYFSPQTHR